MNRKVILIVLLTALALPRAGWSEPAGMANETSATEGEVFAAGLAFMAPRILDQIPVSTLSLWGLQGLREIDPSLNASMTKTLIQLDQSGKLIFSQNLPQEGDSNRWGLLDGEAVRAATRVSAPLRVVSKSTIIESFFDEIFNHLDPYSRYVPPSDADDDRAKRSGSAGIGVHLGSHRGHIIVKAVLSDSPADDSGVRVGDQIVSVDGQDVHGRSAADVENLLAGPDGSTVMLHLRGKDGALDEVGVNRATLPPETVFSEREGDILIVQITGFARDTDARFAHELERHLSDKAHIKGVILDLRGNRGGLLRQAVEATSRILDHGMIVTTAGRDAEAAHQFRTSDGDMTDGLPVVVLVDGRSASAAEIMTAALTDNGRAVAVGSVTMGKGLVQTIAPMPDGGELFVTWSRVLAPRGWPLQGMGVLPQVCTSTGEDALKHQMQSLDQGRLDMLDAVDRERDSRPPVPPLEAKELRSACPPAIAQDADVDAARYLLEHPNAYNAALLPVSTSTAQDTMQH